jgi:hypothetical protein
VSCGYFRIGRKSWIVVLQIHYIAGTLPKRWSKTGNVHMHSIQNWKRKWHLSFFNLWVEWNVLRTVVLLFRKTSPSWILDSLQKLWTKPLPTKNKTSLLGSITIVLFMYGSDTFNDIDSNVHSLHFLSSRLSSALLIYLQACLLSP